MNRNLLARTRPEFYDSWANNLRGAGVSEKDIAEALADSINEAEMLLDERCPKCGAPSARYVDREHQQGPSEMPGAWVQYRCSTDPPPLQPGPRVCGFMVDYKEGDEAN